MVKLAQKIDESARESEYCGFHVKRVLTWYGGGVEKHAVALDEEKGDHHRGVEECSTTRLITS